MKWCAFNGKWFSGSGELYSSEKHGNDETGDGSSEKPFKTVLQAMRHAGKEPFPTIYVDGKEEGKVTDSVKSNSP
jgi:hypothetical protein